eukprot:6410328-Amphidinium_carterae.1
MRMFYVIDMHSKGASSTIHQVCDQTVQFMHHVQDKMFKLYVLTMSCPTYGMFSHLPGKQININVGINNGLSFEKEMASLH